MYRSARRSARLALVAVTAAACAASSLAVGASAAAAAPSAGTAHTSGVTETETYDRFIVHFADGTAADRDDRAARAELSAAGRSAGHRLDFARRLATSGVLLTVPERLDAAQARALLQQVAAHPGVAAVEPDARATTQEAQGDPGIGLQWHYGEPAAGMNVPPAWATATGTATIVAVLDTGITAHPDLDANVVAGYDFLSDAAMARDSTGRDPYPWDEGDWEAAGECGRGAPATDSSWHGTHVAGTVAALRDNGAGGTGVAYGAQVQPVRVLGRCGGYQSDIADAIVWAAGGTVSGVPANKTPAHVLNLSLGGSGTCGTTYQSAINTAVGLGATVVVAAGNSAANAGSYQPASCANTVVVGATDREGNSAWYSNYGSVVDVSAPGGETATEANGVYSTLNSGATKPEGATYGYYQGTSMATPHVAGLAAMLVGLEPALKPAQVEYKVKAGVRAIPGTCTQSSCGTGLSDAALALTIVVPGSNEYSAGPVTLPDLTATPSPLSVTDRHGLAPAGLKVSVDISHPRRGDLQLDLVGPKGATYRLKSASKNDRTANVVATYTVNASSQTANGTWTLRVTDVYSGSSGTLKRWTLAF